MHPNQHHRETGDSLKKKGTDWVKNTVNLGIQKTKEKFQNLSNKSKGFLIGALLGASIGSVGTYALTSQKSTETLTQSKTETLEDGSKLINDNGVYFYRVQEGDSLWQIWNKLRKDERFSYLDSEYYTPNTTTRNINSFNIPPNELKPGFLLPIPVEKNTREIDIQEFYQSSLQAIDQMQQDPTYGNKIKHLVTKVNKKEVAQIMTAFARSESTNIQSDQKAPIGQVSLHRREPKFKAYSFSHYHILMDPIGKKARNKLNLSEGSTYQSTNGGKLFLAYRIEKNKSLKKENQKPLDYYFNINNEQKAKSIGRIYNGSYEYGEKLWNNIQLCKKLN